jgi:hypothetical protein
MKFIFLFLLMLIMAPAVVLAGGGELLLKKVYNFYGEDGSYRQVVCEFYSKTMVITEKRNSSISDRVIFTPYSAATLKDLARRASWERLSNVSKANCGANANTLVQAYLSPENILILKRSNDCQYDNQLRLGEASRTLRMLAHQYCPYGGH